MLKRVVSLFLLAMIFTVFANKPTNADSKGRSHLIIAADQSYSMYQDGFSGIEIQTNGIVTALSNYIPQCGNTRVSYFAWGNYPDKVETALMQNKQSRFKLASFVSTESEKDLGATNHDMAWSEVKHLVSPHEKTTVVFITNGDGLMSVYEVIPQIKVVKVSILFPSASNYLENDFLPGTGEHRHIVSEDEMYDLILEVLTSLDTTCTG